MALFEKEPSIPIQEILETVNMSFCCSLPANLLWNYTMAGFSKAKGQFESTMIIQTMSIHYTLAVPKKTLKLFEIGDPYALATAAVSNYW